MSVTFKKGGIHPPDMKYLSSGSPIRAVPLPEELIVAMSQHLGAPAVLIKKKGDYVKKGELIGKAASFISANVHSPVSGIITDVKNVFLATGVLSAAVQIVPDKIQEEISKDKIDWEKLSSAELLDLVREMGIVGLGGATFPTNVKLSIPFGKTVDNLIINGSECEPYITSDYRLMLEYPDYILSGIMIIAKIISPKRIFIGVECNKADAIDVLKNNIEKRKLPVKVVSLKTKYPQGDEKQLIKALTNREIPSGKLPLDVGAVVVNAGTAWAVYKSVCLSMPLTERIITISGDCIAEPSNFLVPIGTSIKHLIDVAGGYKEEPDKLICGGPMMGFSFFDENTPVTKGTSAILAIKDTVKHNKTACLHCGRCVASCPIGLEPTRLFSLITNGKYKEAVDNFLMDCKECGCCSFSCPAHLDLVQTMKMGKRLGKK